ncbi:MAG TPA: hypothetical protein VN924_17460 [Bryobacteraceae bacterium]|nr:hypothetical protein [Bryobacteraceae bacterium]
MTTLKSWTRSNITSYLVKTVDGSSIGIAVGRAARSGLPKR